MAATAAAHLGMAPEEIAAAVASFPGVPHRLETVRCLGGVRFVNDTAATIPEAAEAAVQAFVAEPGVGPVYLLAGGSDKGLDLSPLHTAMRHAVATGGGVALLAGTATDRLTAAGGGDGGGTGDGARGGDGGGDARGGTHSDADTPPQFDDIRAAVAHLFDLATRSARGGNHSGEAVILLSPGCASFGMFRNEFDRGDRFTAAVRAL
jgi:UDP-N-acetylmuramoylalanine--D-glutamate ligase